MAPIRLRISGRQGMVVHKAVRFRKGGTTDQYANLTGYGARIVVKRYTDSPTALYSHTVADASGWLVIDAIDGRIRVTLPAIVTALLPLRCVYDLDLLPAGGDPFPLLTGEIVLTRDQV